MVTPFLAENQVLQCITMNGKQLFLEEQPVENASEENQARLSELNGNSEFPFQNSELNGFKT